jgi:hypothetical protein
VIGPFNARMAKPLVPIIRGLYAGDMVIIFFDGAATAKDGVPYHNTYTWYFRMKAGQVIKATVFLTPESSMNSGAACRLRRELTLFPSTPHKSASRSDLVTWPRFCTD